MVVENLQLEKTEVCEKFRMLEEELEECRNKLQYTEKTLKETQANLDEALARSMKQDDQVDMDPNIDSVDRLNAEELLEKAIEQFGSRKLLIEKVQADENCMFRAISYAVTGSQIKHGEYRRMAADYLDSNRDKFRDYVKETKELDEIIENTRKDGSYEGEFDLTALSAALQLVIEVHQAMGPTLIYGSGVKDTSVKPIQLAYVREIRYYCAIKCDGHVHSGYEMYIKTRKMKGRAKSKAQIRIEDSQAKVEVFSQSKELDLVVQDDCRAISIGLGGAAALGLGGVRVNSDRKSLITRARGLKGECEADEDVVHLRAAEAKLGKVSYRHVSKTQIDEAFDRVTTRKGDVLTGSRGE